MSLIEKEYFTLAEVIDALGMPWTDIIYLAENGHLRLSVIVFQLPVDRGYCDDSMPDDVDRPSPGDPSNLTGLVDLGDRDAHLILKNGSAAVADFKAKPKEYCNIADGARPQTFKKDDLLLRRSERARLESLVKSKTASTRAEHFTHSHGYREVTINGHRISLGARQADVVRQLHEAKRRIRKQPDARPFQIQAAGVALAYRIRPQRPLSPCHTTTSRRAPQNPAKAPIDR
jgi:hypothetical protein